MGGPTNEARDAGAPRQSDLDAKINRLFPGVVVRKDLVKAVKGNAIVPSYVLEYLRGQYAASDDEATIQAGIDTVRKILAEHYVHRSESELVKSTIRERGSTWSSTSKSGLMKILYPDGEATREETEEILRFAIEGRKRVKDQILRIDPTMAEVKVGYLDMDGTWHGVATLEEDEYAAYYHRGRKEETEPEKALTDADPLGGASASTEPTPEPELFQGHREYQDGQRGVSYDSLLVPYLGVPRGSRSSTPTCECSKVQKQYEFLLQVRKSAAGLGIVFDVEFAVSPAIHDRSITTDTGWKIMLGRGLDIFQRMSDSPFDLATKYQKYRELKGFGITYLRGSDE